MKSLAEVYTYFRDVRLFFVSKTLKKGEKINLSSVDVIKLYRESRGVAPHILGTQFHALSALPQGHKPRYPLNRMLSGPSELVSKVWSTEKPLFLLRNAKPGFSSS